MATTPPQLSRKDSTSQHGNRPPRCNNVDPANAATGHKETPALQQNSVSSREARTCIGLIAPVLPGAVTY